MTFRSTSQPSISLQPRIVFLLQAKIIQAREVIQAVGFHRGISSERKRSVSRRRPGKYINRGSADPQWAVKPPSTGGATPSTKLAPGLQSQRTDAAISSGRPSRAIG